MRASHLAAAVAALVFSCASRAHAAGPLIVNGAGTPLVWRVSPIPFNPDQGSLGARTNAQAVADIAADFAVWAAVPTAVISFSNAGALPVDVTLANYATYFGMCNDGLNPIIFDTDGKITDDLLGAGASKSVMALAGPDCWSYTSATITEGSALLNGKWIDGTTSSSNPEISVADFNAAVIREFGHYVNLDNSQINLTEAKDHTTANDNAVATMYPFLVNGAQQASLNLDDQVSISSLYPGPSFASDFGQIIGSILLPNGEGAFQGAYVIARKVGDPRLTAVGAASGARFFPDTPGGRPAPALRALYEIPGLPPGDYTVEIEEINSSFTDDASVGPLDPPANLPGPAEFWNGPNESNTNPPDSPSASVPVTVSAGQTVSGIDIIINGSITGPANDRCTAPTVIGAAPFAATLKTSAATTGIYDPFQTCTAGGPNQNGNSVWYTFTAPTNGTLTVNTSGSNYDTVLAAYTGACGSLAQVACNDDSGGTRQSQISFAATGGTSYAFEVTDFDANGGTLRFALSFSGATPTATPTSTATPPTTATLTPTRTAAAITPAATETATVEPLPSQTPTTRQAETPTLTPTGPTTSTPTTAAAGTPTSTPTLDVSATPISTETPTSAPSQLATSTPTPSPTSGSACAGAIDYAVLAWGSTPARGAAVRLGRQAQVGHSVCAQVIYALRGAHVDGSVIATQDGGMAMTVGDATEVTGNVVTGGGWIRAFGDVVVHGEVNTSGGAPELSECAAAHCTAETRRTQFAALPADVILGPVRIAAAARQAIPATGGFGAGRIVIDAPDIWLRGGATLTLVGGAATQAVILRVSGRLVLGHGATVELAGGLTPEQVIFLVDGRVTILRNGRLSGTVFAAQDIGLGTNTTVDGALLSPADVRVWRAAVVTPHPFVGW